MILRTMFRCLKVTLLNLIMQLIFFLLSKTLIFEIFVFVLAKSSIKLTLSTIIIGHCGELGLLFIKGLEKKVSCW